MCAALAVALGGSGCDGGDGSTQGSSTAADTDAATSDAAGGSTTGTAGGAAAGTDGGTATSGTSATATGSGSGASTATSVTGGGSATTAEPGTTTASSGDDTSGATTTGGPADDGLPAEVGPDDRTAQLGCELWALEPTPLVAAATIEEAAQVVVPLASDVAYRVTLPESGPGYITVQVADWHVYTAIFTGPGTYGELAIGAADEQWDPYAPARRNAICGTHMDERFLVHEWGAYIYEFDADGPRTAWFAAAVMR